MKTIFELEKTKNNYGFQHQNSIITEEFISYAKTATHPVLDIGAAYGAATLACLENGSHVIAVDICREHLNILEERTQPQLKRQLTVNCAHFPQSLLLKEESIAGALLTHVLSFLSIEELENSISMLYQWLIPSGKVFIVNYTPYHNSIKNFIPIYLERKSKGDPWPGFIEDKWEYINDCELSKGVPAKLHLFDDDVLRRAFVENSFVIEKCYLFGGASNGVPEPFCLDGREWVGLVARKR